jgi:DNA-directed RNA polymerase specialized sigma24 family protein
MEEMEEQGRVVKDEALLQSFLSATDDAETETLLGRLLSERAAPLIRTIINARLHLARQSDAAESDEADDIHNEVLTQLLGRLRRLRANPQETSINDFRSYVAVITYNVYYAHLRRKYPERRRLKNKIRYLLGNWEDFSIWEAGEHTWLCGLANWRESNIAPASVQSLQEVCASTESLADSGLPPGDLRGAPLASLLDAIFRRLQRPIELDALINAVADLQGIKERVAYDEGDEDKDNFLTECLADARADFATGVEQRLYLRRLWDEILTLPPRQRAALLLNIKSGQESVLPLFPLIGVATIRQIAEAVNIAIERFVELWKELPLQDNVIAEQLNLTRQQVINLRKSARERLWRHMRMLEAGNKNGPGAMRR